MSEKTNAPLREIDFWFAVVQAPDTVKASFQSFVRVVLERLGEGYYDMANAPHWLRVLQQDCQSATRTGITNAPLSELVRTLSAVLPEKYGGPLHYFPLEEEALWWWMRKNLTRFVTPGSPCQCLIAKPLSTFVLGDLKVYPRPRGDGSWVHPCYDFNLPLPLWANDLGTNFDTALSDYDGRVQVRKALKILARAKPQYEDRVREALQGVNNA